MTTPSFQVGDRVVVTKGRFAGRAGVVDRLPKTITDYVYVKLDRTSRSKGDRRDLFPIAHLALEPPKLPNLDLEPEGSR